MQWVIKSVLQHHMTGDCKLLSDFVAQVSAALLRCNCYVITGSRSRSPPRSRLLKYNAVVENLCRSITIAVHWSFSEVLLLSFFFGSREKSKCGGEVDTKVFFAYLWRFCFGFFFPPLLFSVRDGDRKSAQIIFRQLQENYVDKTTVKRDINSLENL